MDLTPAIEFLTATPIYFNILAGLLVGAIVARLTVRRDKRDLQDHDEESIVRDAQRMARSERSRNWPAFLHVDDLNNIYVQNVATLAHTILAGMESIGRRLVNLYERPMNKRIIDSHLRKKSGGATINSAVRNGIPLDGKELRSTPTIRMKS